MSTGVCQIVIRLQLLRIVLRIETATAASCNGAASTIVRSCNHPHRYSTRDLSNKPTKQSDALLLPCANIHIKIIWLLSGMLVTFIT